MFDQHQPGSRDVYRTSELGVMISRAIADHAEEIRNTAESGDPPLCVVAPIVCEHIDENIYWRLAERLIGELLGPDFEPIGRKEVPISGYRRGRCYTRRVQPITV
ncbi:hypothetical protein [Sphingomonas mesophila]|uniref:hypothetical protein n=1 Tax=Sphingomonas mesophila TaxID=2303576 RepID=UPI0013C2C4B9|nr:hypothetical protein [Sphingomonas mesophila]